ncbi:MAG: AbrB/MazE/SpoVT family DNA-binding domain-containing protein [Candidatus Nanoarchaeia archaeon]|nr:AbrB/MazE/SpoVT family DNA-binding domain-containing protein [Candidatus Nanoarchaeia archaeon]
MESRKLIKLGNSSFAIALPKDWIEKSGLKKGDKIYVERNSNGEIIISPEFKKLNGEKRSIINVDNEDEKTIKRKFTNDYISGSSSFEFTGKTIKEKSRKIKNLIGDYIGCEISEETANSIIVKDFFNFEETDMNSFIKRIENNILEMFDIILSSLEKQTVSKKEIEEAIEIDSDINKFYFLNSRIMSLGLDNPALLNVLKIGTKDLFNNWWITFHLEHAGDNLKSIISAFDSEKLDEKIKNKLSPIFKELKEKYRNALHLLYEKNDKQAFEVLDNGKRALAMCEDLTKSKNSFLSIIGEKLYRVDNAVYQIIKMISNLKS